MKSPHSKSRFHFAVDVPNSLYRREGTINSLTSVGTNPSNNQPLCVNPSSFSRLGTFRFEVTYNSPFPTAVKAIAYPAGLYPFFTTDSNCPVSAVNGISTDGGATYKWDTANQVPGADYSDTGLPNYVTIWIKTGTGPFTFDEAHFRTGITNGTGPCRGSGSTPSSGTISIIAMLSNVGVLQVMVPDGPHAGQYYAKRSGALSWEFTAANCKYILCAGEGRDLVLKVNGQTVPSKTLKFNPVSATYPGVAFGAKGEVVVFAK